MDKHCDGVGNSDDYNRFTLFSIPIGDPKLRSQYRRLQSSIYNFLERPCGAISVSYHFAVFGLVVAGLVFAVLETMPGLKDDQDLTFGIYVLEVFLLTLFTLEYALRMWSAGCRSTYVGFLGRVRFAFKPFVVVDLIVIGSTCAVIIPSQKPSLSSAISILRFFQVLRMVRFDRQGGSWKLLGSVLYLHRQELLTTIYIGFCSLIFATFFVYQAEKTVNKAEFETFADSFWWGVVTLTTVGYGDKVPKSWAGRGIAAFFAIMGISFFALPAGILGSGFALKVSQQQRQKQAKRRRRPAAMLIQCNWRYYASRKDSKLIATWSPYIRFLQEKNARKEEAQNNSEKPVQFTGRARKISMFGRKASVLSSDGISKPEASASAATTPEHFRLRSKKSIGNDFFPSSDSLQDTDDEHGRNSVVQNVIIVKDSSGNACLPPSYKQSIRFTRYLKFLVALKKFKLAKKPYDVKDVIEQYNTGHVELLGKVRGIGSKIDEALGYKVGTEKIDENPTNSRTNLVHRLSKLEKQVKSLDFKLDRVISLLEKNDFPVIKTLSEEGKVSSCSVCGQNNAAEENNSNEKLPLMQVNENHITPTRRRKFAMANTIPKVNEGSNGLREEDEPVTSEDYVASTVPCLLTEDLMGVKRNSLNEFDSAVKTQPDVQPFDGNYLSPKPFGCESYDLRSRSDSAFSEKPDDGNSTGVSPASSDSECPSSTSTVVVLPSDINNDTSTLGGNHLQETRM